MVGCNWVGASVMEAQIRLVCRSNLGNICILIPDTKSVRYSEFIVIIFQMNFTAIIKRPDQFRILLLIQSLSKGEGPVFFNGTGFPRHSLL